MNTKNILLTAALCLAFASPVLAQSASTNTTNGAVAGQSSGKSAGSGSDDGGKTSGGGAPLAGAYDETNVTPDAPMGKMDMSKSTMFTAEEKAEATGRCKVVSKNPSKYKADVVEFCKGMM